MQWQGEGSKPSLTHYRKPTGRNSKSAGHLFEGRFALFTCYATLSFHFLFQSRDKDSRLQYILHIAHRAAYGVSSTAVAINDSNLKKEKKSATWLGNTSMSTYCTNENYNSFLFTVWKYFIFLRPFHPFIKWKHPIQLKNLKTPPQTQASLWSKKLKRGNLA